jgi:hypothetical protein
LLQSELRVSSHLVHVSNLVLASFVLVESDSMRSSYSLGESDYVVGSGILFSFNYLPGSSVLATVSLPLSSGYAVISLVVVTSGSICSSFSFFSSDGGRSAALVIVSEPFFTWDDDNHSDDHIKSALRIVSGCIISSDSLGESACVLETLASDRSDVAVYSAFVVWSSSHSSPQISRVSGALAQSGIGPRSGFAIDSDSFYFSLCPPTQRVLSSQAVAFSMALLSSISNLDFSRFLSASFLFGSSTKRSHRPFVYPSTGFVDSQGVVIVRVTSVQSFVDGALFSSSRVIFSGPNVNEAKIGSNAITLIVGLVPGLFVLLMFVGIVLYFWRRSPVTEQSTDAWSFDYHVGDVQEVEQWPFLPRHVPDFDRTHVARDSSSYLDRPRVASDYSSDFQSVAE